MSSSPTSNEPKPSSDSPSEPDTVVACTTGGLLIKIADANPWRMAYGTWAERAKVG